MVSEFSLFQPDISDFTEKFPHLAEELGERSEEFAKLVATSRAIIEELLELFSLSYSPELIEALVEYRISKQTPRGDNWIVD